MLGMVYALVTLEQMVPVPFLPPHVKPGFANIIIMFCVFFVGRRKAFMLNCLKALFVLITRGVIAGLLSLSGGVLSIAVIIILASLKNKTIGYAFISVMGAVTHNMAQLMVIMVLMGSTALIYYAPVLVIAGVAAGLLTGGLLKTLLPVLKNIIRND